MNLRKAGFILLSVFVLAPDMKVQAQTDSLKMPADSIKKPVINVSFNDSIQKDSLVVLPDTSRRDSVKIATGNISGYEISGKIEDKGTGEGVPFASIYISHSGIGTAADLNGNFSFKTDYLPNDTLMVSAVGYNNYKRRLDKKKHEYAFYIELERSTNALKEVVVHAGEDPALVLLRQIIKRKPYNDPDRIDNYKYETYNKLEADLERLSREQFEKIPLLKKFGFIYDNLDTVSEGRPFLPLYLTETVSEYYFQRQPKKQREFIKANLLKGVKNESITKLLGSMYQNVNAYKNFVPVFDKQFVSPISNSGYFYYKYKIKDTQEAYGHKIILVQYEPRRTGENCFYGDFWVVDSIFALQRITMEVPKVANVNFVNRVSLYQEYAPVQDTFWFCIKDKFVADFTGPYNLKIPGFIGRKTTSYRNIVYNDTSVTNVLDDKQYKTDVIVSDSARKYTDKDWLKIRPDTLSKNEKAIYNMVDTLQSMHLFKVYKNIFNILVTGVKDYGPLELGPYWYLYSTNPVEGNRFRLSLGSSNSSFNDVYLTGYLAYGTTDQKIKYQGTALWLLNRKPRMYLYGAYTYDIDHSTNYYDQVGSADNIFSVLFRKPGVPWKLAFTNETRFEFYKEYFSGFSHKLMFQHREFTPYAPLPTTNIFLDNDNEPTSTVTSSDATLKFRFAYKEKFLEGKFLRISLGSIYPIVELTGTASLKGVWGNVYDYQRLKFSLSDHINIAPFGSIYYNLFAGKYFGTLPYPLLEIHPGNEYLYYNTYAFEMMNKYEFISDQYAGFNFEHNIGGGIFNHIPLLRKLKLRQFWTAKGVIGSLSDANSTLNLNKGYPFRTLQGDPYVELGTGVSNIFELFRIDFVWRVTPQPLPGESKEKYFGIFGSVKFAF
jgi:hypothetical protein